MPGDRAAALAFLHQTVRACADATESHPLGTLFLSPTLPEVWSLNGVAVHDEHPGLTLDDLGALFDERFPGRSASAMLEAPETAERIEAQARALGWEVEHELVMALRRDPDRVADTSGVRPAAEDEVLPLIERWFAEEHPDDPPETLRQLNEYALREWHARPTRAFVAGDGQATCKVWSDGATGQVEDVYTAPEARGGGYARALVTHAIGVLRAEGLDLVFIVADDDATPKELYARLGFDPLQRSTRVVRKLG